LAHENKKIIEKIVGLNQDWEDAAKTVLSSDEIYDTPLYLILFVLARIAEQNEYSDTIDIISLFKEIVGNDLRRIHNAYPGLALTLFYWANMYKDYDHPPFITWTALLQIADFYNGNDEIGKQFSQLKEGNPIAEILSHYLSLELLDNPVLPNTYIFYFHHDLLAQEGLSQPINQEWHFDGDKKLQILEVLIKKKEHNSASDLYHSFVDYPSIENKKLVFKNEKQEHSFYLRAGVHRPVRNVILFNNVLKNYYSKAGQAPYSTNEQFWMRFLDAIPLFMGSTLYDPPHHYYFKSYHQKIVLKNFIEKGCQAKCIHKAYKSMPISITDILKLQLFLLLFCKKRIISVLDKIK
jgi:hypothetical protein